MGKMDARNRSRISAALRRELWTGMLDQQSLQWGRGSGSEVLQAVFLRAISELPDGSAVHSQNPQQFTRLHLVIYEIRRRPRLERLLLAIFADHARILMGGKATSR
jgi:hypothetical protein